MRLGDAREGASPTPKSTAGEARGDTAEEGEGDDEPVFHSTVAARPEPPSPPGSVRSRSAFENVYIPPPRRNTLELALLITLGTLVCSVEEAFCGLLTGSPLFAKLLRLRWQAAAFQELAEDREVVYAVRKRPRVLSRE